MGASLSFEACERKSGENGRLGLKENFDFAKACNEENGLLIGAREHPHPVYLRRRISYVKQSTWQTKPDARFTCI